MNSSINNLCYIFEKHLKWKLNQKAKTSADEFRLLMNTFKYYDFNPVGHVDKEQWKQSILKLGIIGFSEEKLNDLFDYYLFNQNKNINNNSEFLNYKQFGYDLLYKPTNNESNIIKTNNYLNRNNKNTIKNVNFSYDFKSKMKNDKENNKDKNIFNYRINVKINNEQNIIKNNDESEGNKNITNNNNNSYNNYLNRSYNSSNYKIIKLKNIDNINNININDRNNNGINIKLFIKNIIDIFREKVNKDNGITFYTLLQKLILNNEYERNSDILSLSKLHLILKESNLNFTPKELQSLFCIIDFNDTGYISINKFLKVIKGNLNEFRQKILIDIFNNQIDINKNGKILIYYFKKLYNGKNHPDIMNRKKSENEIMTQFNYTFDIFCKLYKIAGEINCEQFIKYYEGISPSIPDDNYFKEIITNVWTRTNDFNETYFPTINNQNINFNLEKKINRSVSSPLISFNNIKMNTIDNNKNRNNNKLIFNNNFNYQSNLLNSNYFKYKTNTLNNNRIVLKKINLTPINTNLKNTNSLILNDIQNNNTLNYKSKYNNNHNQYNSINNINLNTSSKKISIPHSNSNKYFTPNNKLIHSHLINNNNITNQESNKNQEKDKYNYSQIILNSLRNILIKRGNKSIFYLQRMLTNCDTGQTGLISLSQLNNIFRAYNFNIYFYDIKLLFELFDKNKIGIIQYDNLVKAVVGTMNNNRKNLIIKLYENLNKDLYGFINIKDMKKRYNCYKHPEFIKGNKTHEEVYGDFLECIEIYREYICNINKKNNDLFSYNEFLEFFDEISMYINDDGYFKILILGCWEIK